MICTFSHSEGKIVSKLKKAALLAKDSVVKDVPLISIDDVSEEEKDNKTAAPAPQVQARFVYNPYVTNSL